MSPRYTVLAIPGTFESHRGDDRIEPVGMCAQVTRYLDPEIFECVNVGYPADFGLHGMSEVESMATCQARLHEMIRATPLPVVLVGYSQGAQVVRKLLADIAADDVTTRDLFIAGAGLIADPERNLGDAIAGSPNMGGCGIAGQGPAWPPDIPVWQLALRLDPITNSATSSPLRPIADVLKWFNVFHPIDWIRDCRAMIAVRGAQSASFTLGSATLAVRDLDHYLREHWHERYAIELFPGTDRTYTEQLAHVIAGHFATVALTAVDAGDRG